MSAFCNNVVHMSKKHPLFGESAENVKFTTVCDIWILILHTITIYAENVKILIQPRDSSLKMMLNQYIVIKN